jgi:hypothetical protein
MVKSEGMRRPAVWFALLTLVCVFSGCASDPENTLASPIYAGAPGVKRFLVCAPNTVVALPAELQGATGPLREQVDAYLHFHDRDAQWLDLYESKRLWTEALGAAKAQGAIEKTPAYFAREAAEHYEFDAIVMPSILLHKTRATDNNASWDGVSRRMQILNAPRRPTGRAQSTLADGIAFGGISGEVLVTSVHVLIFTREGERVFEGRGGVGFVHDVDVSVKKNSWSLRVRDPVIDVDSLREGIAIAFDPYLTPPEE